ncbi:hypothetical protein ALQ33_03016 [Pseudomonas syringae pv. philadelphi]|uniref:Uncharacterized protein n=2 Tax=Pseudomonas syringae group genomosp. 3 TaxID=251701 RepID=A0A3M3ZIT9_9PSED|nr:hypothetical protein ALQ33_03016 [Pseudomonas syringae pv. philadelphi]
MILRHCNYEILNFKVCSDELKRCESARDLFSTAAAGTANQLNHHKTRKVEHIANKEAETMTLPTPPVAPDPNIDNPVLPGTPPRPDNEPPPTMPPVIDPPEEAPPVGDPPAQEPPVVV